LKFEKIIFLSIPTLLVADVVWPALYLEVRLFSWWAIGLGLVVEYFLIKPLLKLTFRQTILYVTTVNIISAILGIILIPLGGILWEIFPAGIYNYLFGWGTFNPVTWGGTLVLAAWINAMVEGLAYNKIFKIKIIFKSKEFWYLFLINILSVSFAFVSIWVYPVHL